MKTMYFIMPILLTTILSGCHPLLVASVYDSATRSSRERNEKIRRAELREKTDKANAQIEAGDLKLSKQCVLGRCDTRDRDALRHAAENILKADQQNSEPELYKIAYMMASHNIIAYNMGKDKQSTSEKRMHYNAIVQLAQSKALWNYANIEECSQDEDFRSIQRSLSSALTNLILINFSNKTVDYDPYQSFVCDISPFQKETFLINAKREACSAKPSCRGNNPIYSPCKQAKEIWGERAYDTINDHLWTVVTTEKERLASAERCILECEKSDHIANVASLHKYSASVVIDAYKNMTNLDERQQKILKKANELKLKK